MDKQAFLESLSDEQKKMIMRYTGAGALGGASISGLVALNNYFRDLEAESRRARKRDDERMILTVRRPAAVAKQANATALGMGTGLLTMLASYAAIQRAYQAEKLKSKQKELDEAQRMFIDLTSLEAGKQPHKQASKKRRGPGTGDLLSALPALVPAGTILGSFLLSRAYLEKAFPSVKKPERVGPRRVAIRYEDIPTEVEEDSDIEKSATYTCTHYDGLELAFGLAATLAQEAKVASDLVNLTTACAYGHRQKLLEAQAAGEDWLKKAEDLSQGLEKSGAALHLGAAILARDPELRPSAAVLTYSELHDNCPFMSKGASLEGPSADESVAALCTLGRAIRVESDMLSKWAMFGGLHDLVEAIEDTSDEEEELSGQVDDTVLGESPEEDVDLDVIDQLLGGAST